MDPRNYARLCEAAFEPLAAHAGAPRIQHHAGWLRIQLDRPQEHNRLDPADIDALSSLFSEIASRTPGSTRGLLLTGAGERTFSSGYTLQSIATELDDRLDRMLGQLEHLPCLTIAALSGSVYGGATDMALACDLRIGREGLRMFMPAARFGLHYYPGGLRRYVTRLGLGAASMLMLTGMSITSAEMLRIGFLTECVPADRFHERIADIVREVDQTEPVVVARMKADLLALADGGSHAERNALLARIEQSHTDSLSTEALRDRLSARLSMPSLNQTPK